MVVRLRFDFCFVVRMPAQKYGVLRRGDAQGVYGLEFCPALQVSGEQNILRQFFYFDRNGRLELLAMHHRPLMRAMDKIRGHLRP